MPNHQSVLYIGRGGYTAEETIVWLGESAFVKLKTIYTRLLVGFTCHSGIRETV